MPYALGLYDNFESGKNGKLWGGSYDIVTENRNHVAKIERQGSGTTNITMKWPSDIPVEHFQEWSARVKLSSESEGNSFQANLDYHGVAPGGLSWFAQIGIIKFDHGNVGLFGFVANRNTTYRAWKDIGSANVDKWYDLKMVITKKNDSEVQIDFYIDGSLKASEIPPDSPDLINHSIIGLHRNLGVHSSNAEKMVAFFDDVYGVYGHKPANWIQQVEDLSFTESLFDLTGWDRAMREDRRDRQLELRQKRKEEIMKRREEIKK